MHCIALQYIALQCSAVQCIALHCSTLQCIALHCIALLCIALRAFCLCLLAAQWCWALLRDYAEACAETAREARGRPGRALLYAGLAAGLAGCALHCPGEASLEAGLLEASGRLLLLSPATRSPAAEAHVGRLLALRAEGRLRVRGLAFCAVAYEAAFPDDAALYRARCPHLAPAWTALPARLLDLGCCGRWWLLRRAMRDCDVNAEEFAALPPPLRRLDFHHLHSARNERLFQQKFQPAPPLQPHQLQD